MKSARFWAIAVMLASTELLLHARGREIIPVSQPLRQIPHSILGRTGTDVQIAQEVLEVLGNGDFLSRIYTGEDGVEPVGLFVGYFPSQRTGATIHSPRNCLPGAGWTFVSSHYINLIDEAGRSHQVGEYIVAKGNDRQFAIYWYQAHGRSVANEYMARMYLVADAVKMNRTDGALVRVITPIGSNESVAGARLRAEKFTAQLFPMLPGFIPN